MDIALEEPEGTPSALAAQLRTADFDALLNELVHDSAPRLFAVVQVEGERVDGWVAAWGMAFDDGRAHVISVDGALRMSLSSVDRAARWFGRRAGISARLVWLAPAMPATATT